MTFPANYAVIAEDELTYVVGGGVIADVLPAVMTAENWKNVGVNLVKVVGNAALNNLTNAVLNTMFGGNYAFGGVISRLTGEKSVWYGLNGLNKFMQVLSGVAAVYTLGSTTSEGDDADNVKLGDTTITI